MLDGEVAELLALLGWAGLSSCRGADACSWSWENGVVACAEDTLFPGGGRPGAEPLFDISLSSTMLSPWPELGWPDHL